MAQLGGILYLMVRDEAAISIDDETFVERSIIQFGSFDDTGPTLRLGLTKEPMEKLYAAIGAHLEELSRRRRAASMVPIVGPRIEREQ